MASPGDDVGGGKSVGDVVELLAAGPFGPTLTYRFSRRDGIAHASGWRARGGTESFSRLATHLRARPR